MLSGQAIQRGRKSGRIRKGGLLRLSNGVVSAPVQGFLGNGTQVNFIRRQILHKRPFIMGFFEGQVFGFQQFGIQFPCLLYRLHQLGCEHLLIIPYNVRRVLAATSVYHVLHFLKVLADKIQIFASFGKR